MIHTLRPPKGSTHRRRRVARGIGSGLGKTAGRGTKGQKARRQIHPRFEGGQTPIQRRLPVKKGFRNPNHKEFAIVNFDDLEKLFEKGDEVTPEKLIKLGIIHDAKDGVKILAFGELTKKLKVSAHKFSKAASEQITKLGGEVISSVTVAGLGGGGGFGPGDKSLRLSLFETLRLAWADSDIRERIVFVLMVFGVYALGVHIPVPIPGIDPSTFEAAVKNNPFLAMMNTFGGGGLKRISILALGLNPYITSSIIMQILQTAIPSMKKEMQEGGQYARQRQSRNTRLLMLVLCVFQGGGLLQMIGPSLGTISLLSRIEILTFWTAGAMAMLYLGELVTERGIGNGVSLMIFAGICISVPNVVSIVADAYRNHVNGFGVFQIILLVALFVVTTTIVVFFTIAQRRIPIQHMRRQIGTKVLGGTASYLPLSLNLAGVIPIIFAISLIYMPAQFASMVPPGGFKNFLEYVARFLYPDFRHWQGYVGALVYCGLIFFFSYFWTAVQYNVDDIADNLKRGGSFIPGVRPGKQTKDFLDGVISRITLVGSFFLTIAALSQYVVPVIAPGIMNIGLLFGTSLLIMVSVALETMRQIEANILMKQYGQ